MKKMKFIKDDRSECMAGNTYSIRIVRPCGLIETDEGSERLNDAIQKARRIIQDSEVKRLEIKTIAGGVCHYQYDAIDVKPVFRMVRE